MPELTDTGEKIPENWIMVFDHMQIAMLSQWGRT
jgi:hypothetical protein